MEDQVSVESQAHEDMRFMSTADAMPDLQIPQLGVVGASFKTASIEAREELARSVSVKKVISLLEENQALSDSQVVLLSTCNRVEIYYYSPAPLQLEKSLRDLFHGIKHGLSVYKYVGSRAVYHLFKVAAGLDSLVIGEAQILSQVREANRLSIESNISGAVISRLFSKAYENAKKAREGNPEFAKGLNSSVSHAIMQLISTEYAEKKPNVLLIGSGKMIRLATSSMERTKLGKVVIAARRKSLDDLEADLIVNIAEIAKTIRDQSIDVVITATSSESHILSANDFALNPIQKRVLILDISVPRNIDPSIGKLNGVTLLNLDDLKDRIEALSLSDQESAESIREALEEKSVEFTAWVMDYNEILPLMASLRKRAETIRTQELENAFARIPDLTPDQKLVVEKMTERLIRRFLHEPGERLKKLSREEDQERAKRYAEAILELFSPSASDGLAGTVAESAPSESQH